MFLLNVYNGVFFILTNLFISSLFQKLRILDIEQVDEELEKKCSTAMVVEHFFRQYKNNNKKKKYCSSQSRSVRDMWSCAWADLSSSSDTNRRLLLESQEYDNLYSEAY